MMEMISRIMNKVKQIIYKILNWKTLKYTKLYGIPKLLFPKRIKLGTNVSINDRVFIHGVGGVEIKENSVLSYGATIISTGLDTENWNSVQGGHSHKNKKIVIGKNVWLGANVTVLPGVTIMDDIVVGAGSVVTKDLLESGCVYVGAPAKKTRRL